MGSGLCVATQPGEKQETFEEAQTTNHRGLVCLLGQSYRIPAVLESCSTDLKKNVFF